MQYVILDLEMNPIPGKWKEARRICKHEIIQIGAVLLDESFQEIGSFMTLVKPEYAERITGKIKSLTGISTEKVVAAPAFARAMDMFLSWLNSIPEEIEIHQWSKSDFTQIMNEIQLKDYPLDDDKVKALSGWMDFQDEYDRILGVNRQMSLSQATMLAGVEFVGRAHDALADARNTGALLMTVRTPELCKYALDNVIQALEPEPIGTTIADFFDFSQFQFSA